MASSSMARSSLPYGGLPLYFAVRSLTALRAVAVSISPPVTDCFNWSSMVLDTTGTGFCGAATGGIGRPSIASISEATGHGPDDVCPGIGCGGSASYAVRAAGSPDRNLNESPISYAVCAAGAPDRNLNESPILIVLPSLCCFSIAFSSSRLAFSWYNS